MKYLKTKTVKSPQRGTLRSAGIDFFVPDEANYVVFPRSDVLIPSGIRCNIPAGFVLIAFNKSGVSSKRKLTVGACVVDEDYQGEIHIHLFNNTDEKIYIKGGEKITQFVLLPVNYENMVEVHTERDAFPQITERGEMGFGSTDLQK